MKETFDAKIADLQSALVESNGQKDALQTQVDALQGAVQVTTASLDDTEACQQGIVDAIHGGSADDIKGVWSGCGREWVRCSTVLSAKTSPSSTHPSSASPAHPNTPLWLSRLASLISFLHSDLYIPQI